MWKIRVKPDTREVVHTGRLARSEELQLERQSPDMNSTSADLVLEWGTPKIGDRLL